MTKPKPLKFQVVLKLRPEHHPHDHQGWRRLKRFLKALGRNYGFRNEGVTIIDETGAEVPDANSNSGE